MRYACVSSLLLLLSAFISLSSAAQTPSPPSILIQIETAFAGIKAVNNIQLSGTAHWYAGSLRDSGPATLTASSTGAATMQLALSTKGNWTESQSAIAMGMNCQWAGSDAVVHQGEFMNCNRPVVWFLPLISLQPAKLSGDVGILDLGNGRVGPGMYRHLQVGTAFAAMPADLVSRSLLASTTELGLDPSTLFPRVLTYQTQPDNGAQTQIQIEVRYSNYQRIDDVELPFTIQRFVNGSLQLQIDVTSAQIS